MLYRFRLKHDAQIRFIIVEVPMRNLPKDCLAGSVYEKPLLFPKAEPSDMHRLHDTALRTIYEHFTSLNKEQLGATHILNYLPSYHAIFTEGSSDTKLSKLVVKEIDPRSDCNGQKDRDKCQCADGGRDAVTSQDFVEHNRCSCASFSRMNAMMAEQSMMLKVLKEVRANLVLASQFSRKYS